MQTNKNRWISNWREGEKTAGEKKSIQHSRTWTDHLIFRGLRGGACLVTGCVWAGKEIGTCSTTGVFSFFSFQLLQCSARLCVDVLNSPDKYRSMKPSKVQLRWFICIGCADTAVEHVSVSQSTFRLRVDLFTLRFRLTFSLRLRFRLRFHGSFFGLDGCWRFRFRNFGLVALHWQVFHVPQFLQFLKLENDENEPN